MVPQSMIDSRRWIGWMRKDGRKIPFPLGAPRGVTYVDPRYWRTGPEAKALLRPGVMLGFMLGDGWAGIDIDDCVTPPEDSSRQGLLSDFARATLDRFQSFAEISPSGTGVKIYLRIDPGLELGNRVKEGLEVYTAKRFFAVTGRALGVGDMEVFERTEALIDFIREQFGTLADPGAPSTRRLAYPGLHIGSVLKHLTVVRHTRYGPIEKWQIRCPFHPEDRPAGHGDAAALILNHETGNISAGCQGARCQTGYGPGQQHRWFFRDLLRYLTVLTGDVTLDSDEYERVLDPAAGAKLWEAD